MSVPYWKIKRELSRPLKQLRQLPERLGTLLFAQSYYDRFLAPKKKVTSGGAGLTRKLAVYLIFPQNGLLPSHLGALQYLLKNGYSPIVVSNVALKSEERDQLHSLSHLIIERPNFGYDFGGYRDGVLEVINRISEIDRLVLLNDSAWFPLPGSKNWLEQAEHLKLDFVGAASNFGHARVNPEDFRNIKWSYSSDHRNFHYCSFALMISGSLMRDTEFAKFWKKFPLTNNKTVTVRRGEIGLSRWVIQHGFTHGTTLDISDFDQILASLSEAELRTIAEETLVPEMQRTKSVKVNLLKGEATRTELIGFILTAIARQGISYTQPRLMHRMRGFSFLKKSPLWLDEDASNLTLKFLKGLARDQKEEFAVQILDEALDLRAHRAKTFEDYRDEGPEAGP